MLAAIMIAFRNLGKTIRKSSLLALAVFLCSTILLIAFFAFNGVERQTLRNYVNVQAGHVIVLWNDLAESDTSSPQRFINVYEALTYHPDEARENQEALTTVENWLTDNEDQVDRTFPIVRRNAVIETTQTTDSTFLTYSLTSEHRNFLVDNKSLSLAEGRFPDADADEVVISQDKAANLGLTVGDEVDIATITDAGQTVNTRFTVCGIYTDGAFYENLYGFLDDETARRVYAVPDGSYDSMLVFLKDRSDAQGFADGLEDRLQADGTVLHAESYLDANSFYNNTPAMIKAVFGVFIVFVLLIIALGMQSSVKMSLYQRMKEIGSMRAIGFGKAQVYTMIFFETFFLTVAALIPALVVSLGFVLVFENRGIFVGPAASALFGGQYFYPEARAQQVFVVLAIMLGFSLLSTIQPGLAMVNQTIVDMMNRNMKSRRQAKLEAQLVRSASATA